MERIVVTGTSGSGKTTLARTLAERLKLPYIELDALHWEPNWRQADETTFRERIETALAGKDGWVVDGNYSKARDLIWPRADTLIWLDFPAQIFLPRLMRRTLRRVITRENLWGTGNRETLYTHFFTGDSLLLWALTSSRRRKKTYPRLLAQPEHVHLRVYRLYTPHAVKEFLDMVDHKS